MSSGLSLDRQSGGKASHGGRAVDVSISRPLLHVIHHPQLWRVENLFLSLSLSRFSISPQYHPIHLSHTLSSFSSGHVSQPFLLPCREEDPFRACVHRKPDYKKKDYQIGPSLASIA